MTEFEQAVAEALEQAFDDRYPGERFGVPDIAVILAPRVAAAIHALTSALPSGGATSREAALRILRGDFS